MTINGKSFKRLIFCDSHFASAVEQNLESFRNTGYFPGLLIRYEREVWVDFIHGQPIKEINDDVACKMGNFYKELYSKNPVLVETKNTVFPDRLDRDLHFLHQIGIISHDVFQELKVFADAACPQHCWLGFDYTDPVRKNFLLSTKQSDICAVDVEGLVRDYLIGMGAAKALVRWLNPHKEQFFRVLTDNSVPDFQSYYEFVELCFLAQWMKRAFLEHDWKALQPVYFEGFRKR